MKHIKTTAAITAALLLCLYGTAEAEYIDSARYNYSANKAEIDGRFFDNFNDSYATILVLKEGGNINKIHDSLVEKQDQVKIKDGKFSFSFPLSEPGSYTAYVEAGGKSRVTTFTCANDIDMINADLFTIGSEDAFAKVVDMYAKELNISESVYGKLKDKEKASKLAFAEKDNVTSVDEVRDLIKAYSYMEALNESQYSLLLDGYNIIDAEILGFDTLDEDYKVTAYNLYKTLINDAGKTKLFEMMQGQNFKTLDEMKKSFIYNATIAAVKYNKNSGTGHIKTVLENNNAVNGFDLKNYNSSSGNAIDLSLVNGSEWKKEDIQKLLNSKTGSKDDSRGDVGGNGSNRGGTTTGGGKPSGNYSQNYSVNQPDKNGFTDIDESTEWARESIEKLAQKGIVNGRDENSFAPKELVTRAEFLKMVISVFDLKADNAQEAIVQNVKHRLQVEKMRLDRLSNTIPVQFSLVKTKQGAYLDRLMSRLSTNVQSKISEAERHFEILSQNIQPILERKMLNESHRLQLLQQRIQAQDPELLLKRGYSITLKDGKSIRSASQLKAGDIIETRFAEGNVKSEVK